MRRAAFSSILNFAVPILGQQIYDIVSTCASPFHTPRRLFWTGGVY